MFYLLSTEQLHTKKSEYEDKKEKKEDQAEDRPHAVQQ